MGMAASLFNGAEPFEEIAKILLSEGLCEIWWKLIKRFQRRRNSKIHNFIHVYSLRQGQVTPRGQNFDCNLNVFIL